MKTEEFEKLVRRELDWLRYYGLRASREELTINSEIYEDLTSIGYTKRVIPLDKRCAGGIITSEEKIIPGFEIEKLEFDYFPHDKNNNRYTPLEAYIVIFPEKKGEIIEIIKMTNWQRELP